MQLNRDGELNFSRLFGRFSIILTLSAFALNAQSFEDFKNTQAKSFTKYKDERDNAFNGYLKAQWKAYNVFKGTPLYEKPKPKKIAKTKPKKIVSVGPKVSIKIKKAVYIEPKPIKNFITVKVEPKKEIVKVRVEPKKEIVKVTPPPKKKYIAVKKPQKTTKDVSFDFFGSDLGFNVSSDMKQAKFHPKNQKGIASFFNDVASSEHKGFISEIKSVSKTMNLNDWGTYLLVLKISDKIYKNRDDANLLSWFIFNKLGYAVKVGLAKNHVVLMHYSKKTIYSTPSYKFSNKKYFVVSNYNKGGVGRLYTYKQDYPDATKPLNLSIKTLPKFSSDMKRKKLSFKEFGNTYKFSFEYNKNLIDFMATYPQADYETFFNAPMDSRTYESLAKDIKKYVDGMKAGDAMNFVLHFVQKAFKYEQDGQHFGREKVMFATETLYFDKSDCEDRAVLYSHLIKNLFGATVVGVKYSDHMSTAIQAPMSGDRVKLGKRELTVADPTYINANIGQNMPKYRSKKPDKFIFVR